MTEHSVKIIVCENGYSLEFHDTSKSDFSEGWYTEVYQEYSGMSLRVSQFFLDEIFDRARAKKLASFGNGDEQEA